jgi:hypothetical protein
MIYIVIKWSKSLNSFRENLRLGLTKSILGFKYVVHYFDSHMIFEFNQ